MTTTMYIPELGTELEVTESWTFDLHYERRNMDFWGHVVQGNKKSTTSVTLPMGSRLIVDRIYVRNGAKEFSSVTLRLTGCPDPRFLPPKKKSVRFWVKLSDFNTLTGNVIKDTTLVKGAVPTCGTVPLTMSEFKAQIQKARHGKEFWVKGIIDGKPYDEPLYAQFIPPKDVHASATGSFWNGNWTPPKVLFTVPGSLLVCTRRNDVLLLVYPFDPKLLSAGKGKSAILQGTTTGIEPDTEIILNAYFHLPHTNNQTSLVTKRVPQKTYDLTFYKVQNP